MRYLAGVCAIALCAGSVAAQTPVPAVPATTPSPQSAPASPTPPPANQSAAPAAAADTPAAADSGFATDGVSDAAPEARDKYEKINRAMWGFNQTLDRFIMKPVSTVYRTVAPRPARRGVTNVFSNLSEPWSFVNNILQGKPHRAIKNLGRFVVNSTIGIGGLFDQATKIGIQPKPEDFGQTLAVWGVKHSAYLVLPLLGPSTIRDGIGSGVAYFADPYQICLDKCFNLSIWTKRGIGALNIVNIRANLTESGADAFLASSLDPYATARSAYFQRRDADIANSSSSDAHGDKQGGGAATPADGAPTSADSGPASTDSSTTASPAAPPVTAPSSPAPSSAPAPATTPSSDTAAPSPVA